MLSTLLPAGIRPAQMVGMISHDLLTTFAWAIASLIDLSNKQRWAMSAYVTLGSFDDRP